MAAVAAVGVSSGVGLSALGRGDVLCCSSRSAGAVKSACGGQTTGAVQQQQQQHQLKSFNGLRAGDVFRKQYDSLTEAVYGDGEEVVQETFSLVVYAGKNGSVSPGFYGCVFPKCDHVAVRKSSSLRARQMRCSNASSSFVTAELARAEPVYTPEVEKLLETIKWDSKGLVVAIAQHVDTGAILMQGFANRDAIAATIASNHATFFSRSRSSLWTKGESSRNFINVVDVYLDCDRDSIIYLGTPDGPTCHTGAETCYYTSAADFESSSSQALTTLYTLEATIAQRKAEVSAKPSWTKKLVGNPELLCSKIREEADELCRTIVDNEGRERTISEMADLLYHSMVLLAIQDVKVQEVLEVLRGRFPKSGIEEKNNRATKS